MYIFFALHKERKSFQMSTIRLNRKCSKVVRISSDILGNVRKSSENRRKYSEVSRTFSEIPVMTSQKSHAFDLEKVGRYAGSIMKVRPRSAAILIFYSFPVLRCSWKIQEALNWD